MTIFILSLTRIIIDKLCFIYREYDLNELFVEIDLRSSTYFEQKKLLQRTICSIVVKVTLINMLEVQSVIDF